MADTRFGGAEAPGVDPVGRLMGGRFRIGRMLGQGGMGTVHEAVDVGMDRPIALKLLRPELAKDQHQLQRFEREARAAGKLSHPNIVGVTELVRDETLGLGLVMELLEGKSLATRLEEGPLTETEAVNVFMQALDGLAAAHAAGMVHRDLKPSNVFLVPIANGELAKLLDFGIVKLAEEGAVPKLTRKGALIGTPTYMSPEQVSCAPVDARSDVYSMGACLYEALIAQAPYEEPHSLALIAAVGAGPPRDLHEIDRDVSPDLVHVVRVAMSRDPDGRYQTAKAMREALRGAVIQTGPRKPRVLPLRSREQPSHAGTSAATALPGARRPPYLAIAIGALLVVGLVALVIAMRARSNGSVAAPTTIAVPTTVAVAPPTSLALPAPTTTVALPPPTLVVTPPPTTRALPRGIEPPSLPPQTTQVPPPTTTTAARPPITRTPHHGRVGEDVLDPFAP